MSATVLATRGLRKSYAALEVVGGVDITVAQGECFGLLGPNGAGKTTILKLCLGLIDPDGGAIELLGERARASGSCRSSTTSIRTSR